MRPLFLLYISIFLAALGQISMKFGLNRLGGLTLSRENFILLFFAIFLNPLIVLALAIYGVSAFLWSVGLSRVPLSTAYPLVSLSYVGIFLFSWLFFHENISGLKILGLALICLGVFLLSKAT